MRLLRPWTATGTYYLESWRDHLRDGTLVQRPTLFHASQALGDELALAAFQMMPTLGPRVRLDRIEYELETAVELYRERGWLSRPESYHVKPPALSDAEIREVSPVVLRPYRWLQYPSAYEPAPGEPGYERWLSYAANTQAHAWLLTHTEPRPWLVYLHGAFMGRAALDMVLLRARRLHERYGLNVALPVLPLHGVRHHGLSQNTLLGGVDFIDNIHGSAQAVWEVRRLISWIRTHQPAAPVGIAGISLGGYICSLVASLEDDLACAILGIPAHHLRDMLARHMTIPAERRSRLVGLAETAGRVVSPLAMQPRVPPDRRFMYAGVADRFVPRSDVERLWQHWGRPEIAWYGAGHLGYYYSRMADRFVRDALRTSGLISKTR